MECRSVLMDDGTPLRNLSPREVATVIRSLDSHLIQIAYEQAPDGNVLIYTFEVAGMRRSFRLALAPDELESIGDLYAEATVHEQRLVDQFGLAFTPHTHD